MSMEADCLRAIPHRDLACWRKIGRHSFGTKQPRQTRRCGAGYDSSAQFKKQDLEALCRQRVSNGATANPGTHDDYIPQEVVWVARLEMFPIEQTRNPLFGATSWRSGIALYSCPKQLLAQLSAQGKHSTWMTLLPRHRNLCPPWPRRGATLPLYGGAYPSCTKIRWLLAD
jgi:hypothetical protein